LDTDVAKLAAVIEEFMEFVECYHKSVPGVAKQIDKITHNATFFFFFLFDKLSDTPRITTPKVLANRVINKMMILSDDTKNLLNGSNAQQKVKLVKLYKLLGF